MYVVKPFYSPDLCIAANSSSMYAARSYYEDNDVSKSNLSPSIIPTDPVISVKKTSKSPTKDTSSRVTGSAAPIKQDAIAHSDEKLLETRQKLLIDRLNSIKKQLDQLQLKFRTNNNVKREVLCAKTETEVKTTPVEQKKQRNVAEPETRQLATITFSNVDNRKVFDELSKIGQQVNICITADPNQPPFSIFVLCHLIRHRHVSIIPNVYVHSSVNELSDEFWHVFNQTAVENVNDATKSRIILHFIWKHDIINPTMNIKCRLGRAPAYGEETIAKYLSKLANFYSEMGSNEDENEQNNVWYKTAASFVQSNNKGKERILKDANVQLGKNSFILGSNVSLADVCLWSALCKAKMNKEESLPGNVKRWSKLLNNDSCFVNSKRLADVI